ncbi:MAG: hypothetical protein ABIF87_13990 [Pseudomonadota bacterium]
MLFDKLVPAILTAKMILHTVNNRPNPFPLRKINLAKRVLDHYIINPALIPSVFPFWNRGRGKKLFNKAVPYVTKYY